MAFASLSAVMPAQRQPVARPLARWRGSFAGLLLAMLALFAQIAAANPLPSAVSGDGPAARVLGITLPICGETQVPAGPSGGQHQHHLLPCAACVCCHAPAVMPANAPPLLLPAAVVYVARVVLPPASAPPPRLAARPPPRAPPLPAA